MARDNAWVDWRQIAFYDVQICSADTAGKDMKEKMSRLNLRTGHIFYLEIYITLARSRIIDSCFDFETLNVCLLVMPWTKQIPLKVRRTAIVRICCS